MQRKMVERASPRRDSICHLAATLNPLVISRSPQLKKPKNPFSFSSANIDKMMAIKGPLREWT
jgi:hypothetical protein